MAKVLCERISSRRSLLALGWSITSILALGALITAAIMSARINSYYNNLAALYSDDGNYYYNNGQNQEESGSEDQNEEGNINQNLSSISSHSIAFAGLYTACCSVAMSIFGSMSVVGFVSLTGNFIEPAWTRKESGNKVGEKELGIFIGALFLFSNLCLVCAVVLGEFQIVGYLDERQKEELGSYAIEMIATVLAIMCAFLGVIYFLYAILLFALKDVVVTTKNVDNYDINYTKVDESYKSPVLM